jgi:hypothetical protein
MTPVCPEVISFPFSVVPDVNKSVFFHFILPYVESIYAYAYLDSLRVEVNPITNLTNDDFSSAGGKGILVVSFRLIIHMEHDDIDLGPGI